MISGRLACLTRIFRIVPRSCLSLRRNLRYHKCLKTWGSLFASRQWGMYLREMEVLVKANTLRIYTRILSKKELMVMNTNYQWAEVSFPPPVNFQTFKGPYLQFITQNHSSIALIFSGPKSFTEINSILGKPPSIPAIGEKYDLD